MKTSHLAVIGDREWIPVTRIIRQRQLVSCVRLPALFKFQTFISTTQLSFCSWTKTNTEGPHSSTPQPTGGVLVLVGIKSLYSILAGRLTNLLFSHWFKYQTSHFDFRWLHNNHLLQVWLITDFKYSSPSVVFPSSRSTLKYALTMQCSQTMLEC